MPFAFLLLLLLRCADGDREGDRRFGDLLFFLRSPFFLDGESDDGGGGFFLGRGGLAGALVSSCCSVSIFICVRCGGGEARCDGRTRILLRDLRPLYNACIFVAATTSSDDPFLLPSISKSCAPIGGDTISPFARTCGLGFFK